MVRFLNRNSKWLLPQLILYHPKYVARDIEVTKSLLEVVAAPFEAVPSKVVVEASPVNIKLQWILTLQNPYLNWVLPLLIFAQQGQGVYT